MYPSNETFIRDLSYYHERHSEDLHRQHDEVGFNDRPACQHEVPRQTQTLENEQKEEEHNHCQLLSRSHEAAAQCRKGSSVPATCCKRVAHCFINMRCTDSALAVISFTVGLTAISLQLASLCTSNWLYTIEPRAVGNETEINGDPKEYLFRYNSGYWRLCREVYIPPRTNLTATEKYLISTDPEFQSACINWNSPPNGSEDHLGFSKASGAILNRILRSAVLHIVSLAITIVALSQSLPGYIRRDKRTFIAAILYIISGVFVSISVMEYIRVVDDEMAPKMKQTPEGNASKYRADYGWSYLAASMSFLCIEACALVELLLFLRRFPSLEDKMILVPGLKDKIRRAVLHHEFDEILPARTCSRSSPRISFSYTPDDVNDLALSESL